MAAVATFTSLPDAAAACGEDETVVAVSSKARFVDGKLEEADSTVRTFFVVPESASDEEIHSIAYEIQHGEPMDRYGKFIRSMAQQGIGV